MTEPEGAGNPDLEAEAAAGAEFADPYEEMDFRPYDPAEAVRVPAGTPQGTAEDTPNRSGLFDERHREDFEGLAFLGALEASFSYIGHKIVLRTLTVDELLAAGRIIGEYQDTPAGTRAYATVMVALSLVSVDGKGLPAPLGESDDSYGWVRERFDYVKNRWYPYTIDYLYERYLLLENRTQQVLLEMTEQAKKSRSQAG